MCGLAGVLSRFISQQEQEVFENILTMATMRGRYGAGVILVNSDNGHTNTFKTTDNAVSLLDEPKYDELQKTRRSVMIGHARQPTKGDLTVSSVHPHSVDHICGVHNGTMWKVKGEIIQDGQSDSKLLFGDIAARGVDAAVKDLRGAYALVWIDRKQRTLNFLRNDDRPLWFGHPGGSDPYTLYWGSEQNMVALAMIRKNIHKPHLYQLAPNQLTSFDMVPKGKLEPKVREVKQDKDTFQSTSSTVWNGTSWPKQDRPGVRWTFRNGVWTEHPLFETVSKATAEVQEAGKAQEQVTVPQDTVNDLFNPKIGTDTVSDPVLDQPKTHGASSNRWSGRRRRVSKAERKRLKKLENAAKKSHNVGHTSYLETLANHFVSPENMAAYLAKGCAYCGQKEDMETAARKDIRWLDRDTFLCETDADDPSVRENLIDLYPRGWPEFQSPDEPKSVDEQLAETMREAHKYH